MDPIPIRLSKNDIWQKAEEFRRDYIHNEDIPVNIEVVMQSTLGIQIVPTERLQFDCSIDGYISRDFKFIYVDEYHYFSDKHYKRVRFTIAHEIGHRILHRDILESIDFKTSDEWKQFRMKLPESSLGLIEWQAYEFAGRLLVPINQLISEYKAARQDVIKRNRNWNSPKLDDTELFSLVAPQIATRFDVSTEVIERRLDKEEISNYFK